MCHIVLLGFTNHTRPLADDDSAQKYASNIGTHKRLEKVAQVSEHQEKMYINEQLSSNSQLRENGLCLNQ